MGVESTPINLDKSIKTTTMKYIRETIVAGRTVMTRLKASARIKTSNQKRQKKTNPTSEKVRKVNLMNAVWKLTSILNRNFCGKDYHLTLTYSGEESTKEQAKKNLSNYQRAMKRICDKNGIEWKWVAVTEYENHRIHHHIVCSGVDLQILKEKWKYGYVNCKMLDASGEYSQLAEYLIKETEKTFRLPDSVNRKRYSSSSNIIIPEIRREDVSGRVMDKELKPLDGYYIDQDSVRRYEHAILQVECMEYIQISLEDDPRVKRWRRGKKTKYEKHYKEEWAKQLNMFGGEH